MNSAARPLDAPMPLQANRLESLGELASGIAHEINTPAQYVGDNVRFLQAEVGNLFRLIDQYERVLGGMPGAPGRGEIAALQSQIDFDFLKAEIPLAISQSIEGVQRITAIVRAMKDFSHPGSTQTEPADLVNLITSTLEVCRNRWKYVADLKTDFAPDLPAVPCVVAEFNQVILNLIVNAADAIAEKYGSDGAARGLITLSARVVDASVEVRITDDGTGIPDTVKPRLFEQFFTTKPLGKGTGQGLSLCRTVIVERHGGTIDVESTAGVGTTFILRLPLRSAHQITEAS